VAVSIMYGGPGQSDRLSDGRTSGPTESIPPAAKVELRLDPMDSLKHINRIPSAGPAICVVPSKRSPRW